MITTVPARPRPLRLENRCVQNAHHQGWRPGRRNAYLGTLAFVPSLLDTLGLELPVLQAGMGGGIDGHELAAAVSEAGGLGTIGTLDPENLRKELARARRLTGKPLAVNLLLPFARDAHWAVAQEADVVITFWESRRAGHGVSGCTNAAACPRPRRRAPPEPTRSSPRAWRRVVTCAATSARSTSWSRCGVRFRAAL